MNLNELPIQEPIVGASFLNREWRESLSLIGDTLAGDHIDFTEANIPYSGITGDSIKIRGNLFKDILTLSLYIGNGVTSDAQIDLEPLNFLGIPSLVHLYEETAPNIYSILDSIYIDNQVLTLPDFTNKTVIASVSLQRS
jgi:hypothetical protein